MAKNATSLVSFMQAGKYNARGLLVCDIRQTDEPVWSAWLNHDHPLLCLACPKVLTIVLEFLRVEVRVLWKHVEQEICVTRRKREWIIKADKVQAARCQMDDMVSRVAVR